MSAPRNDGGPAFPGVMGPPNEFAPGMSLRDWIAGQAPSAPDNFIFPDHPSAPVAPLDWGGTAEEWDAFQVAYDAYWPEFNSWLARREAAWRVQYADAMLAERAKP